MSPTPLGIYKFEAQREMAVDDEDAPIGGVGRDACMGSRPCLK
jgi:hypothetical protein